MSAGTPARSDPLGLASAARKLMQDFRGTDTSKIELADDEQAPPTVPYLLLQFFFFFLLRQFAVKNCTAEFLLQRPFVEPEIAIHGFKSSFV
jgi:hypothetical protein